MISQQLQRLAEHAHPATIEGIAACQHELDAAGINTPLRMAHFFSQICHESAGLTVMRENCGWTPAQMSALWPRRFPTRRDPRILLCRGDPQRLANLAYSERKDLGNIGDDDGWDYRGGGFMQLTGRANYHNAGNAVGADLEGMPELIEDPGIALRVALWVWARHPNNSFADHNYGRTISNAINRGNPYSGQEPNGAGAREQWFRRAWAIFGGGQQLPDEGQLYLGAYGGTVERIQGQLRDLGYLVGACDGVYGPTMARAVAGFKLDQKRLGIELEPDEVIGQLTMAAIDTADKVQLSSDRTAMSVAGLAQLGSTEIAAGGQMQNVGRGLTAVGAAGAAHQAGLMDGAAQWMQQMTLFQSSAAPAIKAVSWAMGHIWWVILIVGGVYCWRSGWAVKLARLAAHRLGLNLGR